MKRQTKLIIIFSIISLFVFSGCSTRLSKSYEYHPQNNAKKEAKIYFEYLKKKDIESLNKLFSKEVQNSHNLKEEWKGFFDSIDGNLISYKKISFLGEEVRIDNYKVSYSDIVVRFEDVKTDTGKTYERIDYRQLRVNNNHPESEGISVFSIKITDENNREYKEINVGETNIN